MQQEQLSPDSKEDPKIPDLQDLKRLHTASRQQAKRFVLTQLLVTIILSVLLLGFSAVTAYSALTGGLIATIGNAWFALKVFKTEPTVAAGTLLATFYVGEIIKIILTGAMFILAFVLIKPISVLALLVTYFLIHMTPAVQNAFGKH